jgi:hypothetical protein
MLKRIKKLLLRRDTIRALTDVERAAAKAGNVPTCTYLTRDLSTCVAALDTEPPAK